MLQRSPVRYLIVAMFSLCIVFPFASPALADGTEYDSGSSAASATLNLADAVPQVPHKSGTGRRIVYASRMQRAWVVNADNVIVRTFLVSGRRAVPKPGTYRVFSQSVTSFSPILPGVTFRFMTRFAIGPDGGNIGFHELPLRNGKPMQTTDQLGTYQGSGCLRSTTADAKFIFQWAHIGTTVVVVP
ncbi:MAG: L,D-transpeptidase [Ilumatobacteraceae bacterium]